MNRFEAPEVEEIFNSHPEKVRRKLLFLRQLIFDTAAENESVKALKETLKWGQPSYVANGGSTVRIDRINPDLQDVAVYFHCQSKLIETFREVYRETFRFSGNRAIVFESADRVPEAELKHCILIALTYHRRKNLPLLGM